MHNNKAEIEHIIDSVYVHVFNYTNTSIHHRSTTYSPRHSTIYIYVDHLEGGE